MMLSLFISVIKSYSHYIETRKSGKVDQSFEKKNLEKTSTTTEKNTLNPLVKSVFKSVHNYWRYLQFRDRRVCSI